MVLIPEKYAKYHGLDQLDKPIKCKIEDLNIHEARLIFG